MLEFVSYSQSIYWLCAVGGTLFFILKTVGSVLGGFGHELEESGSDHVTAHEGDSSSDAAFQLISITSLTGFFMMFGWFGLAASTQAGASALVSIVIASIAGLITMYAVAKIFQAAGRLTSRGAVFSLQETVGKNATVYQKIPASGKGQIQLTVAGNTHEIAALAEGGNEIESFQTVQVVQIVDSETVLVKLINLNSGE